MKYAWGCEMYRARGSVGTKRIDAYKNPGTGADFARLAENDRTGLARVLHEWEAYTVKSFKIEHLWEPTPFPLELPDAGLPRRPSP